MNILQITTKNQHTFHIYFHLKKAIFKYLNSHYNSFHAEAGNIYEIIIFAKHQQLMIASKKRKNKLKDMFNYLLTVILFDTVKPLQVVLTVYFPTFKFLGILNVAIPFLLVLAVYVLPFSLILTFCLA